MPASVSPDILLKDEGVDKGYIQSLNYVGPSVVASVNSGLGTIDESVFNLSIDAVALSGIATNTYNNGTSGVGATLTANANGTLNVDGVSITTLGQRVLLAGETTGSHNGVYFLTTVGTASVKYVLTRATDADSDAKLRGATYYVKGGGNNINKIYANNNSSTINVGTTSITYTNPTTIAAGSNGMLQYNNNGVLAGLSGSLASGSNLTLGGLLDLGNNAINNVTGLNMSSGAGITNVSYFQFDNTGGGWSNAGDSTMYPGAVLTMSDGIIADINAIEFHSGGSIGDDITYAQIFISDVTNNGRFGCQGNGGVEVGANGDCYGIRRNAGTDPLEIGYNDNVPGRGVNFFSGGFDFGAVKLFNAGAQYMSLDSGTGSFTFSPTGGFIIDGARGGSTVQLTVSGSSGSGNYAIQAIGGQVGLMGSGTDGATTGKGYVGSALAGSIVSAFYAESGTYSLYGAAGILFNSGAVQLGNKVTKYNNITTAGLGVPAIYGSGRVTGKTAAQASVATYTNGASDGTFIVSANVQVTASVTHSFTVTVGYTDETNTARTLTLTFSNLAGTTLNTITNILGTGPYEGFPMHIRVKASTAITINTVGTFTSVTYNAEGIIQQVA